MDEQRYRAAERALWDDAGISPTEHRVHLARNDVNVRVLAVGEGPPVLFLHGGPGAAGAMWSYLAARMPEFRCLLLDRPGTGLSDPHLLTDPAAVRAEAATMVADVLDGLGIDRAHLVGSSHGSYIALLSAAATPDRVGHTVHLGCPGFVDGMALRIFDRLVLAPGVGRLFSRMPANERSMQKICVQLGHEATLRAGGLPQPLMDWFVAVQHHTDTMRNEYASMANMGTFRRGFDPALTISADLLATVASPSHFLWGDNDPYGDQAVAQRVVEAMPNAHLEMMVGAGHLCWFDDADRAATTIRTHLAHAIA